MRCGANSFRGQLVRYADAMSAVAAYDLAVMAALRAARASVPRFVAGLQCPQGCPHKSYEDSTVSISIRRLWGAPSESQPDQHRIVVQADYSFQVLCSPSSAMSSPLADDSPPVEIAAPDPVAEAAPDPVAEAAAEPCKIKFSLEDRSTRKGLGVVDWAIDVTVTAGASDPRHTWRPESCRITGLNFSAWCAPGSWPLANSFGMTRNLLAADYGLRVAHGAGVASVSGTLASGTHGIAVLPGSVIQLAGEAADSQGDNGRFEFFLPLPS